MPSLGVIGKLVKRVPNIKRNVGKQKETDADVSCLLCCIMTISGIFKCNLGEPLCDHKQ